MKNTQLFALLSIPAAPVLADVKLADAYGFMIESTSESSATPDTVYTALVERVDKCWPKDHR